MQNINTQQLFQQASNTLQSIYNEVKQELNSLIGDFNINNIQQSFDLLFKYDKEFRIVICTILKQIFKKQAIIFDQDRLLLDTYVYLINGKVDNIHHFNPQKWIFCDKYILTSILKIFENKMKNLGPKFSRSPLNDLIKDIDIEQVEDYMDLNYKLFESAKKYLFHFIDITKQFDISQLFINQNKQDEIIMMIDQLEREILKTPPNYILVLTLYKKIQLQWKEVILQPIENYKKCLIDQIFQELNKLLPKIKNLNNRIDNLELNLILEALIEFINDYYLNFQIKQYIKKISNIIEELKKQKKNKNEVKMESSKYIQYQEILNLVPQNFQSEFQQIMTINAVTILQKFLKENKLIQIKDMVQQKQLLLIMCQQIGLNLFPDYFREEYSQEINQDHEYNNYHMNEQVQSQPLQLNQYQSEENYQNYFQDQNQDRNKTNDNNSKNAYLNNQNISPNKSRHIPQYKQELNEQTIVDDPQLKQQEFQNENIEIQDESIQNQINENKIKLLYIDQHNDIDEYEFLESNSDKNKNVKSKNLTEAPKQENYQGMQMHNIDKGQNKQQSNLEVNELKKSREIKETQVSNNAINNYQKYSHNNIQDIELKLQILKDRIRKECHLERHTYEVKQEYQTDSIKHKQHTILVNIQQKYIIIKTNMCDEEYILYYDNNHQQNLNQLIQNYSQHQINKKILISKEQYEVYMLLLKITQQQQQQNQFQNQQKNFSHSPIGYFFYHFINLNKFSHSNSNDYFTIIKQLDQYFNEFQESLKIYYILKCVYYTHDIQRQDIIPLNTEVRSLKKDQFEIFVLDQYRDSLFFVSQNIGYQIQLKQQNDYNNNNLFPKCKINRIACDWNSELEFLEFQELSKLSNFVLLQILITLYPPFNCQTYLDQQMRYQIIQQYKSKFENYEINFLERFQITIKSNQTFAKNIKEELKNVKAAESCQYTQIKTKNYKSDNKNILYNYDILFEDIKQKYAYQQYFYIKDNYHYKNSVIFNLSNNKQDQIQSLLIIVNKNCKEINILYQLQQRYKLPEKEYIVVLHMQKSKQIDLKIKECINLIIKVIKNQNINSSFFSFLIRDILLSNDQFLLNFIPKK